MTVPVIGYDDGVLDLSERLPATMRPAVEADAEIPTVENWDASQPRDAAGRFSSGGGVAMGPSMGDEGAGGSGGGRAYRDIGRKELASTMGKTADGLPDQQKEAIIAYRDNEGARMVNRHLRGGYVKKGDLIFEEGPVRPTVGQTVGGLDAAMKKSSLPRDATLYRGMAVMGDSVSLAKKMKPGFTFTDKGFTSTSGSERVASGFLYGQEAMLIAIKVKKGTPAIYTSGVKGTRFKAKSLNETEILLNRGGKYRVTSARVEKRLRGPGNWSGPTKVTHVELELLQ